MKRWRSVVKHLACCGLMLVCGSRGVARDLPQEYVTTTPVLADGVLYVASTISPGHRGHLRAIDILGTFPVTLWDAAERMPLAGSGASPGALASGDPPSVIQPENLYRSLFTNLGEELLPLTAALAARLQGALAVATLDDAVILLHAVRGRRDGSPQQPAGSGEEERRLWGLSRASPVLVGRSPVNPAAGERDRVLYVGGEDGMLHAFLVSRWNQEGERYPLDDPGGGTELWAYLPGSFLPHLQGQRFDDELAELAVHLDGTAVVRELFLDLDGDGRRRWHTLLAVSGTVVADRRSCLAVLDITDPYRPALLWEKLLPGENVGRTRGLVIDACGSAPGAAACLYLTADVNDGHAAAGIHALALTLETGQLRWQFSAPYRASGPVAEATPAVPALMDLDGDDRRDTLVFGDLVGQLWALDLGEGRAYGGAPVFITPGNTAEPIGAGVAVHGRQAIFGSGGVEAASSTYQYALYAVDIFPDGGHLRWRYPLAPGEKVWEVPVIDAAGNLLFATARDYLSLLRAAEQPTAGRVVALSATGEDPVGREAGAAVLGRVVTAPGVTVAVTLTGEVVQFGAARRLAGPGGTPGTVKILSWRQR